MHCNENLTWVSLLIPSFNTPEEYLKECFDSILSQEELGTTFAIEMVIINDGSDPKSTSILENILNNISLKNLSFFKIKYIQMEKNMGIVYCLNKGIYECSNELIFRMDSDDKMVNSRIKKQLEFMIKNPSCVLLGTNMMSFGKMEGIPHRIFFDLTNHPEVLNWEKYKLNKNDWILNHPTLCFRKKEVLLVGNYNLNLKEPFEDLELELRILKKYGFIYNLKEMLLFYRIHENQITILNKDKSEEYKKLKDKLIEKIILED